MLASIITIILLLEPNISELRKTDFSINIFDILFSALFIILTLWTKAYVHSLILDKYNDGSISRIAIIAAYANGQVVRYLPGKVFGILSQTLKLSKVIKASYIWEANITQYFVTNILSVIIILIIALSIKLHNYYYLILLVPFSLIPAVMLARNTITFFFSKIIAFFPTDKTDITDCHFSKRQSAMVIVLLHLEWVLYFIFWYFLTGHEFTSAIYIGTLYAAASLLALLAFVVPNGILVREALFLWLGTQANISIDLLLLYGVVLRVLYMICEVLFYLCVELLLSVGIWIKK